MLGFRDIEDRLELGCSVDCTGTICSGTSASGILAGLLVSFATDEALVGRDLGDDSPEFVSWPKKDHFFADLGVGGEGRPAAAVSDNKGREPRLRGAGRLGKIERSRSKIGSAVLGRVSLTLLLGARPRFSFEGGDDAPDIIEDIELDTEWPGLTVDAESDDTRERGLGIICTSSENPTRVLLIVFGGWLSSELMNSPAPAAV